MKVIDDDTYFNTRFTDITKEDILEQMGRVPFIENKLDLKEDQEPFCTMQVQEYRQILQQKLVGPVYIKTVQKYSAFLCETGFRLINYSKAFHLPQ